MKLSSLMLIAITFAKSISFTRGNMSRNEWGGKVEGYWATSRDPLKDSYQGRYPFPEANDVSWDGKEAFIRKMYAIENYAMNNPERFRNILYRGFSPSRLNSEFVGNSEFQDVIANVAWPDGLRSHYFDTFNVLPSREFYDYVMSFPDELLTCTSEQHGLAK